MRLFFQKIVPHPILTAASLVVWLLLWHSYDASTLLLGLLVAVVLPLFARRFWPDAPRVQNFGALVSYSALFAWDILVANLNVARLILMPNDTLRPTFLEIPLDIDHPFLITILANTISLTPGTVSSNVSGDNSALLVHCLDCADPDEEIDRIKRRYEDRLERIYDY